MSFRNPRHGVIVSDMRADVHHDTSTLGWIIDHDIFVCVMLWSIGILTVTFVIMIIAGV